MKTRKSSPPIHPLMRVPVPWVFIFGYLIGAGLQTLFPVPAGEAGLGHASRVIGIGLFICGLSLAAWSLSIFYSMRTTTVPFKRSSKLVTWGPYRFSRNPMYVSLTLMYIGEAGWLVEVWPLLPLLLVLAYVQRIVIPYEEKQLSKNFGVAYKKYTAKVRRWI
jgi:protein-S-isoprenylcysteine O-methyltransferase Ste14